VRKRLLCASLAVALLATCVVIRIAASRHHVNREVLQDIRIGMTFTEVERRLGAPPGNYLGRGSVAVFGDNTPLMGQERPGARFLDAGSLHFKQWVAEDIAIRVWLDDNDRVFGIVEGQLVPMERSFIDRLCDWLGIR
jgi:hypothetical protein